MPGANQLSVFERYGKLQLMVLSQLVTTFAVLYLATLVIFAILRIFTGISIKRIGYFSLKYIVFHPKTGVEVRIGKLGISFHRPTVARPGWISLHILNCEVIIDTKTVSANSFPLEESQRKAQKKKKDPKLSSKDSREFLNEFNTIQLVPKSKKQLFRLAQWLLPRLKVIDINFGSLSVTYTDVVTVVVGYASYRMDGRSLNTKSAQRTRSVGTLDSYELQPGEMRVISRLQLGDVYIAKSLDDEDPHQVLDTLNWTFSGVLHKEDLSLKELQFGLKGGIVNINCKRLLKIMAKIQSFELSRPVDKEFETKLPNGSATVPVEPQPQPTETQGSHDYCNNWEPSKPKPSNSGKSGESHDEEEKSEAKANGSADAPDAETKNKQEHRRKLAYIGLALLRLVKLIEFKVQSVTVTGIPLKRKALLNGKPVTISSSFNDFSLDVRRMSSESPGFKLVFGSPEAAAHQSIFSLTSLKVAIDNGKIKEEIIYVPMVTVLTKGNVFSGTLQLVQSETGANKSLIRMSANVQSPSVNVETHHLAILEQLFGRDKLGAAAGLAKPKRESKLASEHIKIRIPFQNLLPHLDCSLLIQDPAIRMVVDDQDSMFIVSCSRIGGNLTSTHVTPEAEAGSGAKPDNYYRVNALLETSTVEAFYHSKNIPHFDICSFSSTGLRATAVTRPELSVKVSAWMGNIQFQLLQSEIFQKVRILYLTMGQRQLERRAKSKMRGHKKKSGSALRKLPAFVSEVDFTLDGAKLAVASDEFRNQKNNLLGLEVAIGRVRVDYVRDSQKQPGYSFTDGRNLQVQVTDLKLSRVSEDYHGHTDQNDEQAIRQARLLDMPEFKFDMLTKTEREEPVVAITYNLPKLVADININQLLAVMVIREVVDVAMGSDLRAQETEKMEFEEEARRRSSAGVSTADSQMATAALAAAEAEALANPPDHRIVSGRMGNVRLKVDLPQENRIMFEISHGKIDRARHQNPTLKAKSLRVYSRYPFYRSAWCIVLSLVNVNVTIDALRKTENKIFAEISTMRINIPFRFKLYRIIDNSITMTKAIKTLITQTKKGDPLLFLNPKEHTNLPNIPNVFIRTNRLQLQMEDDKFESDLNLVFQVGRIEAEVRYEMEKMLEKQIKDILRTYVEKMENKEAEKPTVRLKSPDSSPTDTDTDPSEQRPRHPKRSDSQDSTGFFKRLIDLPLDFGTSNSSHPWHRFWNSSSFSHMRQQEVQWPFDDHGGHTSTGTCTCEQAHERLQVYFARSWYRAVNHNRNKQQEGVNNRRNDFADDVMDPATCQEEMIVNYTDTPPIWSLAFMNTDIRITRSLFPDMASTKKFIHDVGKGAPTDLRYSIFVPLHLDIKAYGGARMDMFDFPLPLLHFPALAQNQDPAGTGLHIGGNFIIAEALQTEERSIRRLFVPVQPVPPSEMNVRSVNVLEIHRTLAPIKMFTDLKFVSKSIWPTRVCWCPAYKPAFAALQQGFGGFTKPPIDPSMPLGWWDKIRLVLHGTFTFDLGESPLYFLLKGGRSPYTLAGSDAGFAFVWRKNVKVVINGNDEPKDLFVVNSDVFEFVVPNYLTWEADYVRRCHGERADFWRTDYSAMYESSKVIMRFGNKIQWKLGMMFEQRKPKSLERTSKFMPHWGVQMSMPEYIDDIDKHDCYRGFRSDFMYLSLNIQSTEPGGNNSLHLTVAAFHHFQTWLGQFKSQLWPPIRTGSLFPGEQKPKKAKFSTTLRGVQYQLALKPLVISFVEGRSGRAGHVLSYTYSGAKARATSFVLDLHTRREPVKDSKHWKMRMFLGQVDVENTDVRTLLGRVRPQGAPPRKPTRTATQMSSAASQRAQSYYDTSTDAQSTRPGSSAPSSLNFDSAMPSSFAPESASNHEWSSIDDFTDVGILLGRVTKNDSFQVEVLPFMYIPHFTYMRQTDHSRTPYVYYEGQKYLKFGGEIVHDCLLKNRHPGKIQGDLLAAQREELRERLADATENLRSLEDQPRSQAVNDRIVRAKQIIAQINTAIGRLDMLVEYGYEAYEESQNAKCAQAITPLERHRRNLSEYNTSNTTVSEDADRTPVAGDRTPGNTSAVDASDRRSNLSSDERDLAEEIVGKKVPGDEPELADAGDKGDTSVKKSENNEPLDSDEGFNTEDSVPERLTAPSNRLPFKSRFYMEQTDDLSSPASHYAFDNRYIVYAMHARWNNRVRDRILRLKLAFSYQQNLRHARFYRAISELEELMETLKQNGSKTESDTSNVKKEAEYDDERVHYNSKYRTADSRLRTLIREITEVVDGAELESSHLVRLLTPQIQLISEKNPSKFLQLFARDIDIRVVNLFDEDQQHTPTHKQANRVGCLVDRAAGLVFSEKDQTLFDVGAVSVKSFVLRNADPMLEKHQTPWLSIDQCYNADVLENFMIVKHTDLGIRIDSPNALHYSTKGSRECTMTDGKRRRVNVRLDHSRYKDLTNICIEDPSIDKLIMVDLPQLVVACDSVQFFTAYMIATDLIAYHDPIHQSYSDAVDRVILSTDFSGGSEQMIQHIRKRQLQVNQLYHYRLKYLTRNTGTVRGTYSRRLHHIESEYYKATLELMVLTKAFTAGVQQSIRPDATHYNKISVLVDEVIGHILDEHGKSFLDIAMAHLHYSRVSSENQFGMNQVKVGMFQGWNLLPNAIYPEILSPFGKFDKTRPQVSVRWTSLEPVGGIPILDDVSIKIQPLRLQFEQHIVDLLMDFAFPVRTESKKKHLPSSEQDSRASDSDEEISDSEASFDYDDDPESEADQSSDNRSQMSANGSTSDKRRSRLGRFFRGGNSHLRRPSETDGDVNEMVNRASSYMNLMEFLIHSTELTVSYKGRSRNNLLDLQEVTIPLPNIHYSNKMWNKLDLLERLKKDIVRVLVNHSYAIIGNRFRRHKDKGVVIKGPIEHYNPLQRVRSAGSAVTDHLTHISRNTEAEDNMLHVTPIYQMDEARRPSTVPLMMPRQPTEKIDHNDVLSDAQSSINSRKSHNPFKRLKNKMHHHHHHHQHQ